MRLSPALADPDALLEFKPCAAAAPLWEFFLGRPGRLRNTRTWYGIVVWWVVGICPRGRLQEWQLGKVGFG